MQESDTHASVPDRQRGKQVLCGLGMAAATATVGYVYGLVWAPRNAILLAACFGATGAFAGLLGYGPVVGIFVAVARLFGLCRGTPAKQKAAGRDVQSPPRELHT